MAVSAIIYNTVDRRKLQLADDTGKFIGTIDSYNNWFTDIFSQLFGMSMKVKIGNKTRCLNKTEYAAWINTHTERRGLTKKNVKEFKDFCLFQVNRAAPGAPCMRFTLSTDKSSKLYQKLVHSMVERQDFVKARKHVGKGADLDRLFWTRGEYNVSFGQMTAQLPEHALDLTATRYTPLLYAATKRQADLCNFMTGCQANQAIVGQEFQFKRQILQVKPITRLEPRYYHVRDYPLGSHRASTYHSEWHMDVRTTIVADFQDQHKELNQLIFNPADNSVQKRAGDGIINNTYFSRVVNSHSTRLI